MIWETGQNGIKFTIRYHETKQPKQFLEPSKSLQT